jgi:uncharacterized membrane protein
MKYIYKILFSLAILFFCQTPALARDQITDWYVKDLKTEIVVNQDSSLTITENILADCGQLPNKHGIFRILPKKYKTVDGTFNLPVKLISITDEAGRKLDYSVSSDSDTITFKIGDPNITVYGENFYKIKYQVKNAIRTANPNFDELYWNILGNYWDLEIDNFTANIVFPDGINPDNTKISYYAGFLSSKTSDLATYDWSEQSVLTVKSNRAFLKNQGITISAAFPKNIISPYQASFKDKYGFSVYDILLFLLFPIITIFLSFYFWQNNKIKFNYRTTIVPEFEIPDNLTPIEIGGLLKKGELDKNSIAATIIHLGVLGYLRIERTTKKVLFVETSEFKLVNTKKIVAEDLNELEKYILSIILGTTAEVELENITMTISSHFTTLNQKILKQLTDKKFIDKDFKNKKDMIVAGAIGGLMICAFLLYNISLIMVPGIVLSIAMVVVFSFSASILTPAGMEMTRRIEGFKLYMKTAEKYRSRFQEQNDILDKLLPYAILFGITGEWLGKMKDIYGEDYMNNYSASYMVGSIGLSNFVNSVTDVSSHISDGVASAISANTSSSSSGFSGGGFSGGGGGGGGGGGW